MCKYAKFKSRFVEESEGEIPRIRVIQRFLFFDFFWTLATVLDLTGEEEDGRKEGGREREGGRVRLNSLGSGWFRFRDWFVFALGWMDGWSAGGSRLVCLASLVWSGWSGLVWLAVLSSVGGVITRSVLSVCSFVSYCMLYTVLLLSCLCALLILT